MKETHQRFPQRSFTLPAMIPDDNLSGISRPPEICVDYLSHEWNECDIWTSWKAMSKQKKEIANGIRLENASWRTWAKQKHHLQTVNPSKLNWMKDSDVTWLYGPLHTYSPLLMETSPKSQTAEDKLDLCHKSCLKKRPRTFLNSSSDTQLYQKDSESISSKSSISQIRFNNKVEQYIAVDSAEEEEMIDDESGSSSDDSAIVMKISRGRRVTKGTICKLEPTTLKSDRIADNQYSALYSSSRRNSKHSSGRSSGYSSSSSTQRATTTTTTTTTASSETLSDNSCLSSSPNSIPSSQTSLPYPTYSNSCSYSDELDVDDYTGFGIIAPVIFDDFDTSPIRSRCFDENRGDDTEFDGAGLVDRAAHIASNVKDIVDWCSSMVFNGQVF